MTEHVWVATYVDTQESESDIRSKVCATRAAGLRALTSMIGQDNWSVAYDDLDDSERVACDPDLRVMMSRPLVAVSAYWGGSYNSNGETHERWTHDAQQYATLELTDVVSW